MTITRPDTTSTDADEIDRKPAHRGGQRPDLEPYRAFVSDRLPKSQMGAGC